MEKRRRLEMLFALVLVLIALISFFALAKFLSTSTAFNGTYAALEEKQNTVAEISAISVAAASILHYVPGGEALSKELVELGGYFIIILAAIYLEKILIGISGLAAFKVLIPIGLFAGAGYILTKNEAMKSMSKKLISFGIILFLLVPSSVWISNLVENNRELFSGQQEIEELQIEIKEIEGKSEDEEIDEDAGFFDKLRNRTADAAASIKELPAKIKRFPTFAKEKYDALMDYVAFFLITTCVIPIVVLVLLIEIVKQLFGISGKIDYLSLAKAPGKALGNRINRSDDTGQQ